ncbi:MAG TPA: HAMP domain-containing histidine kinase, partial [Bacteroidetes bacterium]|nr:HAMP domain-containing histidine kinase [Bacteroidota bacterium]
EALAAQIRRLQNRVNSLLNLSALEQGRLQIAWQACPVTGVLDSALAALQESVAEKNVRIVREGPEELHLRADPVLAEEILQNILENALRYAPEESAVTVRWAPVQTREGSAVQVSIRDEGPGIAEEDRATLFQPFSPAQSRDRPAGRLHLGLYMAKQFIEAMGGRLAISSEPGRGTCVELRFRAAPAVATKPEKEDSHAQSNPDR